MKKGLTLALTMLALTMLVVPVSAVAPIIPEPPAIIIGNAGDEADGKSLFRYLGVLDLIDYVDWQNPSYSDQTYRAYASFATDASGIDVNVSGADAWIPELTNTELTALVNTGAEPPAAKNILGTTSTLHLMNVSASVGNPASAVAADPAVNGVADHDTATYQPDMDAEPTVMTFVAAVTNPDGGVKASAPALFSIYSLLGEEDAWDFSQYAYIEHAPGDTWIPSMPGQETSVIKPGTVAPGGKVGYEVSAVDDPANKIIFGQFQLGNGTASVFPLVADEVSMGGKLYNARARLRNTDAPSANLCPGYRFEYASNGYVHFGGIEVNTYDAANAPYAGHDFWANLVWEVPFQMTETADGEQLSDWYWNGGDWRQYQLLFDLFHNQFGDRGLFTLEEVVVEAIDRPATPSSTKTYADMTTWATLGLAAYAPDTFEDGSATKTADSITVITGTKDTDAGNRFFQVNPPVDGTFTQTAMKAASNKIYQLFCDAESVDDETTPLFRMYLHTYDTDEFGNPDDATAYMTNITWFDMYGSLVPFAKQWDDWAGRQTGQNPPGVPPDDAAVLTSAWAYSHTVLGANEYFAPDFSVQSQNFYVGDAKWSDDSGGVIISNAGINAY